jgi:uncharacterized membrane protein YqaE (UPF0057 family)
MLSGMIKHFIPSMPLPLSTRDKVLLLVAIPIPPLPVFLKTKFGTPFLLSIILSLLFFVPIVWPMYFCAIGHSWWIIYTWNDVNGLSTREKVTLIGAGKNNGASMVGMTTAYHAAGTGYRPDVIVAFPEFPPPVWKR